MSRALKTQKVEGPPTSDENIFSANIFKKKQRRKFIFMCKKGPLFPQVRGEK
jgi:hypothetical protein